EAVHAVVTDQQHVESGAAAHRGHVQHVAGVVEHMRNHSGDVLDVPIGDTSSTSPEWLRMCSAIMCSREWTASESRCSVLGWVKRTSNLVSTSPPGSSWRSAMRR